MPLLSSGAGPLRPDRRNSGSGAIPNLPPAPAGVYDRLRPKSLDVCSGPGCRTGWLRLWRGRSGPIFEDGWTCSPACTELRLRSAVAREIDGRAGARPGHRHRVPIGLLMMEQGWITSEQLRHAVEAQKSAGAGRLGDWLIAQKSASEELVARALGLQWSCPVLSIDSYDCSSLTVVTPRLFVDGFGVLPLRLAAGQVLYLGFEESLDPSLALAVERMNEVRVESGIVRQSLFRPVHEKILDSRFPSVELVEAISLDAAAFALAKAVEQRKPVASRLVRVRDCLWLRLWSRAPIGPLPEVDAVHDVLCAIGSIV
jgi:hypothetical protein